MSDFKKLLEWDEKKANQESLNYVNNLTEKFRKDMSDQSRRNDFQWGFFEGNRWQHQQLVPLLRQALESLEKISIGKEDYERWSEELGTNHSPSLSWYDLNNIASETLIKIREALEGEVK